MSDFTPFHAVHAAALAAVASLTALAVRTGRARAARASGRARETVFALLTIAVWLVHAAGRALARPFDAGSAFPLALCEITALILPVAILTRRRALVNIVYFWGLGLCAQGLLTPVLHSGPDTIEFWTFWYAHGAIVGTAIYFVMVDRYRPTWRDWRFAVGAGLTYVAIVFSIDVRWGLDYGFLGDSLPDQHSVLDVLGPWPLRVVMMSVFAISLFAVLMLPWQMRHLARARVTTGAMEVVSSSSDSREG